MTSQVKSGVDLSIRQFREAWRLMCRGCPGRSLASTNGIEDIFSGLPIGFFNMAILSRQSISGDALKSYGDEACVGRRQGGALVVRPHTRRARRPGSMRGLIPRRLRAVVGHAADRHVGPAGAFRSNEPGQPAAHGAGRRCRMFGGARCQLGGLRDGPRCGQVRNWHTRSFWNDHVPVLGGPRYAEPAARLS